MRNFQAIVIGTVMGLVTATGMAFNMVLPAMATSAKTESVSPQQAYSIGLEAFCYFYPLSIMNETRRQSTNMKAGIKPGFGPANTFSHMRAYPDANFRTVVRMNFDTLYSSAWLDLTAEPMIVSVPDTAGRYYLLPMLDMWTDVFASPGWRTSGTGAHHYAVVPTSWSGPIPDGVERIDAPTPYVWIIGRIKTDGPDDYKAVHVVQDGLTITPLSQWGKPGHAVETAIDTSVNMTTPPLEAVNKMSARTYFAQAAELLKLHKPHATDWSLMARLRRVGFEPGKSFDIDKLDPAVSRELTRGAADGLKLMVDKVSTVGRRVNGWSMSTDSIGVYGDYYLKRAIVAMVGLGANQAEDAVYPLNFADADGKPLVGNNKYILHFDKAQLPPVDAFWSVTMYDANGYQVANSINRFALSSWMPLTMNTDGSLDLYLQNESPGADKQSNWLPSPPSGGLGVTMRLYAPAASVLNGDWSPPAVSRVH